MFRLGPHLRTLGARPHCTAEAGVLKVPFPGPSASPCQFQVGLTSPRQTYWGELTSEPTGEGGRPAVSPEPRGAAACFPGGSSDGVWSWGWQGAVAS